VPITWQPPQAGVRDRAYLDHTTGPVHSFAASQDLLGDGSVRLLSTPGADQGILCLWRALEGTAGNQGVSEDGCGV